jgi:hypothetical protein
MRQTPLILWLVIHAAEAVGWKVAHNPLGNSLAVTVTEDSPNLTRRPRSWLVTAEEIHDSH